MAWYESCSFMQLSPCSIKCWMGVCSFWADIPMIPRNTKQVMNKYLFMLILFVCCYDIEYDQLIELELLQFDRVALVASV